MEKHRGAIGLSQALGPEYWRELCPQLSVGDELPRLRGSEDGNKPPFELEIDSAVSAKLRARMDKEGYFTGASGSEFGGSKEKFEALADAILTLEKHGWPSTFLMVYNEVWELQESVAEIMKAATGNPPNMDMLAFHVDPNKGDAGFSPHRDRQPKDVAGSFREDGSPKYSTCWLALRDATPENSCLYFIPRQADPGYYDGDGNGVNDDMMRDALSTKESYQNIRAIPLQQGEAAFFSHRIIHWGSRGREGYPLPRLAVSFAFSDNDFEPHYIQVSQGNYPPLNVRLSLAAAQMLVYHERFEPDSKALTMYEALYKNASNQLHDSYRKKVNLEFISAVKYAEKNVDNLVEADDIEQGEDVLDDVLDMMLDAVEEGYGEFEDDFEASDNEGDGQPGSGNDVEADKVKEKVIHGAVDAVDNSPGRLDKRQRTE